MRQTKTGTSPGFQSSNNPRAAHTWQMHAAIFLLAVSPVLQLCHEDDRWSNHKDRGEEVFAHMRIGVIEAIEKTTTMEERSLEEI